MANPRMEIAAAIAANDAIVDLIDGGTTNSEGRIEIRTGAQPASVDDAATGTLLGTLLMTNPAFGASSDQAPHARATAATISDDTDADAAGTAGHFRVIDRDSGAVLDGDITVSAGGGDLELNAIVIAAGAIISITGFTFDHLEL